MKKILCAILSILLLFPTLSLAENLHNLLGIPFTVEMEEFIEIVKEKTGFELMQREEYDPSTLHLYDDPGIMIAGYPASYVYSAFDDDSGCLAELSIFWDFDDDVPDEFVAECFSNILFMVEQSYGSASLLYCVVTTDDMIEDIAYVNIEKSDERINTEDLIKLQRSPVISADIGAEINNIGLVFTIHSAYYKETYEIEEPARRIQLFCYEDLLQSEIYLPDDMPTIDEIIAD